MSNRTTVRRREMPLNLREGQVCPQCRFSIGNASYAAVKPADISPNHLKVAVAIGWVAIAIGRVPVFINGVAIVVGRVAIVVDRVPIFIHRISVVIVTVVIAVTKASFLGCHILAFFPTRPSLHFLDQAIVQGGQGCTVGREATRKRIR